MDWTRPKVAKGTPGRDFQIMLMPLSIQKITADWRAVLNRSGNHRYGRPERHRLAHQVHSRPDRRLQWLLYRVQVWNHQASQT